MLQEKSLVDAVGWPRMFRRITSHLRGLPDRYRVRRTPIGCGYALADDASMLNAEHWDSVTRDRSVFLSRRYLSVLQRHAPEGVRLHAALIYREGKPIVAVAAQSIRIRGEQIAAKGGGEGRRGKRTWTRALRGVDQRVMVCGNLLSWGNHGVAFAADVDERVGWAAVTEALYRLRKSQGIFGRTDLILLKDLPGDDSGAAAALHPYSYRPFATEPDMVLQLDPKWNDFADYLASLRKDYRKAIRNTHKQIEEAGLTLHRLTTDELMRESDAIHRL